MGAGFEQVSSNSVFKGWLFRVDQIEIIDPAGKRFDRFVVHHPGAVAVIPLGDNGVVTLVRQYRAALDDEVLEAPAGTCDVPGEDREVTARRELSEEVGLLAGSMERLIEVYNTPGISDQRTTIYLATELSNCEANPAGIEEHWMSKETVSLFQLDNLLSSGKILDETTILGLMMARSVFLKR